MKKLLTMLLLVSILLSRTLTVLAGDVPESLMYDEHAQLFFGEVLSYETSNLTVSPIAVIKGPVEEGAEQIYPDPRLIGDFCVVKGKVYLFIYVNANNIYVFEVTTYDTKTLKLKHAEGSMWKRFETYLNEGKYGEAKINGVLPYKVNIVRGCIVAIVCVGIVTGAVVLLKKRKKKP